MHICGRMDMLLLVIGLLIHQGFGAPISEPRDVEKRRESTPEIINLEQQLKKASGENKQMFSFNGGQPLPQIDGLVEAEAGEGVPLDDLPNIPDGDGGYVQMLKLLKQHPEYMEDIMQEYMNSVEEERTRNENGSPNDSHYPFGNGEDKSDEIEEVNDAEDRDDALRADYIASMPDTYIKPDSWPDLDAGLSQIETEVSDPREPETEGDDDEDTDENNHDHIYDDDDDDGDDEEDDTLDVDEEELHSLHGQEPAENESSDILNESEEQEEQNMEDIAQDVNSAGRISHNVDASKQQKEDVATPPRYIMCMQVQTL